MMQQCTEKMESQLKNREDFSSTLKDNPIELMKAIKEETHHFRANVHDVAVVTKVAKDLLNLKQGLCYEPERGQSVCDHLATEDCNKLITNKSNMEQPSTIHWGC